MNYFLNYFIFIYFIFLYIENKIFNSNHLLLQVYKIKKNLLIKGKYSAIVKSFPMIPRPKSKHNPTKWKKNQL